MHLVPSSAAARLGLAPKSAVRFYEPDPIFELAPVALWLEDWSALKTLLDAWNLPDPQALREYLTQDVARVKACAGLMRIISVNQKTLAQFEAKNQSELVERISEIFRDEMLDNLVEELVQLWGGNKGVSSLGVNYTLNGARLDVQVKGRILPGYEDDWARVLVATENVTERENARRAILQGQAYASGLFEHSPVSLWVEDFSAVKKLMDQLRAQGISDFRVFTDVHPDFVQRCMSEIRVIDVNRHTLKLFGASDRETLLKNLHHIFRDGMREPFREQLIELWNGLLFQQREVINYALDGSMLHLHLQFSVLPGHQDDWALVQVALTDITARKKAENYLEFLGKFDVLTKLNNRGFYVDELNRLERKGPFPVTIIIIDINGLKAVNDQLGHAAGDDLLRRAGEILGKAIEKPFTAARIGGDEFALVLPAADEQAGLKIMADIQKLTELNNQFFPGAALNFAMGMATANATDRLDDIIKRADARMYKAKRDFKGERRKP